MIDATIGILITFFILFAVCIAIFFLIISPHCTIWMMKDRIKQHFTEKLNSFEGKTSIKLIAIIPINNGKIDVDGIKFKKANKI